MKNTERKRITVSVSPERKIIKEDLVKFAKNFLVFTAPALAAFFAQLKLGVSPKEAMPLVALITWGLLADLFKKWSEKKYYN
jgi:hypothetical protein